MAANEPAFTCSPDQAKRLAQDLKSAGVPALRAEAGWILGRILERAGRVKEAQAELESLIADIGLFREVLPGVLGAWYWENRAAIARQYLDVMLQRSGVKTQTYVDGSAVLAAFEWVRMLGSSQSPGYALESLSATSLDRNSLRTLISRLPNGHSESLAAQINRELAGLRSATVASRPDQPASARQVEGWLNGLGRDEVLLSYYFSEPNVYALIADSGQVRLTRLAQGQRIARQLSALRDEIQSGGQNGLAYLDTLGELMLKPVQGVLTSTVFLLSTGPLHGVPLDALRTDAAFFAANHRVVNVLSMETASRGLPAVNRDYEQRVFLAGRPRDSHRLFEYDVQVAPEIARLTDRFVGPGLHIVQGVALHSDEFLDENFASASLIHLASPGTIDLRFPEQSRLRLSGTEDNPGKGLIYPSDIRAFPQSADLVTLSSIAARGENPSGFDSRVGLVSDFLEGGANAVLTSLWLQPQDVVTEFMDDFYERLSLDPQVLDSLVAVRRERLKSVTPEQFVSWAGFQLYIR